VLHVDDDVALSKAVTMLLRKSDLRLVQTRTLAHALAYLRESERLPDVILMDLCLPDSSGLATLVAIVHEARSTPIVVFTGCEADEGDLDTIKRGVTSYLVKGSTGLGDLAELLIGVVGDAVPHVIERTDSQVMSMVERVRNVMQG